MSIINNDLNPIDFRKDFSYAKTVPTFVSLNTGGSDEIARWVLDRNDILYKDEPHAPHLCIKAINKLKADINIILKNKNNIADLGMAQEKIDELSDTFIDSVIECGILTPVVYDCGTIWNGHHRLVLAMLLDIEYIPVVMRGSSEENYDLPQAIDDHWEV